MKRFLFLDDEEWRQKAARERYGRQYDLFQPRGIRQFLSCLRSGRFDVMSLDHDLGENETGMEAVAAIVELAPELHPEVIIIHSWNEPAARNMIAALSGQGFRVVRKLFSARGP